MFFLRYYLYNNYMRLYNFLKNKYNLSKSELNNFYNNHTILLDDTKATLLSIIDTKVLKIDNQIIDTNIELVYYMYNKPIGVECTNNTNIDNNIKSIVNIKERVFPIGRLDKDSRGLIILTNDQAICNEVLNKDNHIEKEYIVKVDKIITEEFITNMSRGVSILNRITKPCIVKRIDDYTFDIILKEGLNRQIRRMCKALNYTVIDLQRIRFGSLVLDIDENCKKLIKLENILSKN